MFLGIGNIAGPAPLGRNRALDDQGVPQVTLLAAQNIAVVPPAAGWQTGSAGSVQVALLVHAVEQTA
jgi:hypothetical protein